MRSGILPIFIAFLTMASAAAQTNTLPTDSGGTITITTLWESRYVSQGVNWLGHDGIRSLDVRLERNGCVLGAWYGRGDGGDYGELDLYIEYDAAFAGFEAYLGLNRLEYIDDEAFDHELYAGFLYTPCHWFQPEVNYSAFLETGGGFLDVGARSEWYWLDEALRLTAALTHGIDLGYVTEDRARSHHLQARMEIGIRLMEGVEATGYVAREWLDPSVPERPDADLVWGGVGITVSR